MPYTIMNDFITPFTNNKSATVIKIREHLSANERLSVALQKISKSKTHPCNVCGNTFQRPSHLLRHIKVVHKIEPPLRTKNAPGKYICRVCDRRFTSSGNRWRHENHMHKFKIEFKRKVTCGSCKSECRSKKDLLEHITENHPELNKSEEHVFNSLADFKTWKNEIEEETVSSYILTDTYRKKTAYVKRYSCHRSGYFKSRGKGIRRVKLCGTNKIGSFCPANMHVEIETNSKNILVKYFPTHFGHDFELKRQRLSKSEKDKIAGSLYAGVSIPSILKIIAKTSSSSERLAALNWTDIKNIATSYGVDIPKEKNYNYKKKIQDELE